MKLNSVVSSYIQPGCISLFLSCGNNARIFVLRCQLSIVPIIVELTYAFITTTFSTQLVTSSAWIKLYSC